MHACLPSGNVLVDTLARKWYGEEYDKDGNRVCEIIMLERMLRMGLGYTCNIKDKGGSRSMKGGSD